MIEDQLLQEIIDLVLEVGGPIRRPITRETRISEDIRIGGDDVVELMEKFFERFNVDWAGYDHYKYFGLEGCSPIGSVYYGPGHKLGASQVEWSPHSITVGDLVVVARAGKWVEPPPVPNRDPPLRKRIWKWVRGKFA